MKQAFVYILSNRKNGTLYVGVTSDLLKRIYEHKNAAMQGFTSKYGLHLLVYFEEFSHIRQAIEREKQLKSGSRAKKLELINAINPSWRDLYDDFF